MENKILAPMRYPVRLSARRLPLYVAALATTVAVSMPKQIHAQTTDGTQVQDGDVGDTGGDQIGESLEVQDDIEDAVVLHLPNTPKFALSINQAVTAPPKVSVTTYHYNNRRNGWNNAEATLTPAVVSSSKFNLVHNVPVDEQVDAQPLVLTNQAISNKGIRDVVYVATENNTIYAIDTSTGEPLLTQNFGPAVPKQPDCPNNSATVGINSTPVYDVTTKLIYVIVYSFENATPVFRLHALEPSTLLDAIPPRIIDASHTLADGSTFTFNASATRQRAALLATNGNIYAGFASFCDHSFSRSRGWILGWNASNLQPMGSNYLNNRLAREKNNYFLSSVWMSGYGLAAEGKGNLLFATGNSDINANSNSYDKSLNLSESTVKIGLDLSAVKDFFTPSDVATLERDDNDFGSGGLMALPTQPGSVPYLVVAGGKDGRLFLMDRTNMGQYTPGGPNRVVGTFQMGQCWCGPSYFGASDGGGRVVSSGGDQIIVWRVQTSPSRTLIREHATAQLPKTVQDPGSFTTISSNGTQANSAIIWTVRRPDTNPGNLTLYAFDASTGATLTSSAAGPWPNLQNNANIVPVVANGNVFVGGYKQLAIYGLGSATPLRLRPLVVTPPAPVGGHRVSGTVASVSNDAFTLTTRSGRPVRALATEAIQLEQAAPLIVGSNLEVQGSFDAAGVLLSAVITHAKQPESWLPDE